MFNLDFLGAIRRTELEELAQLIPDGARVLEFGAGTGEQARMLAHRGFDVVAIDLAGSSYAPSRVWPIIEYDGRNIPLPDSSVDVIFSSNVLEHVEDVPAILSEFRRVLRPGGVEIHAMPTTAWRFWSFVAGVPAAAQAAALLLCQLVSPPPQTTRLRQAARNLKTFAGALLPIGHGVSREGITELWTFSRAAWRKTFSRNGHVVLEDRPVGIFYTGHMALGRRLSFDGRRSLGRILGSGSHVYVVRPAGLD